VSASSFSCFQAAGDEIDVTLALSNLGVVNAVHLVGSGNRAFERNCSFCT
jgi:hypothetical protein